MFQNIFNNIEIINGYSDLLKSAKEELIMDIQRSDTIINNLTFPLHHKVAGLKKSILDAIVMKDDITLSSGEKSNWYFDFMKTYPLSDAALNVMMPTYSPVGILTGGGFIVSKNSHCGFVDVHKGIFYPPLLGDNKITLIDDVFSTGNSMRKAINIINDYNIKNKDGGYYVIGEKKVLLYRTDIATKHQRDIHSLFISVQLDNQEMPKLIYVGRNK